MREVISSTPGQFLVALSSTRKKQDVVLIKTEDVTQKGYQVIN